MPTSAPTLLARSLNELSVYVRGLVENKLWLQVLIGFALGALLGVFLNPSMGYIQAETSISISHWLNLPGEVFMKMVQMVMIPLIFTSIMSGLVNNASDTLQSFGVRLLLYFLFTTMVAITLGVLAAYILRPGDYISNSGPFSVTAATPAVESAAKPAINIPESIANMIPVNPLEAILTGELLSIVIFTIIIGIALTQLDSKTARPVISFMEAIQKICMVVVGWAMRLVPYAVFGLIAAMMASTGTEALLGLGYYMVVVLAGLLALTLFYLLVYALLTRQNPWHFLQHIRDAQLLAFSTASSAAVMPLSMKVADEKLGISSKISDFVIPIGATINMDGTALFQSLTVIFLAQVYGIELALTDVVLLSFTVVAASIGTPAIPGGGVVVLATVLQSSGIPAEGLLVIVGIDRILGMFRTAVNVTGDLVATSIFNRWYGGVVKVPAVA